MAEAPVTAFTRTTPTAAVFAVTAVGGLLISLDVSVANSLLPAIGRDFTGNDRAVLSWVITGYAIVFAAMLVPAGRVADRVGRRRTFVGGLIVFAAGSLTCGVAPDIGVLLAGRVVQGLGAAACSPASLGLLLAACDPRQRARYAARWTGAAAVGMCLGPLVGGVMTAVGDWRWAFLVNLPIVAVAVLSASRLLPETPRHPGRPMPDPLGAGVFVLAAGAVTIVLSESATWGLTSARTLGALSAGAVLTAAFAVRATHVREPMLDLALMRNRRVTVAAAVAAAYSAGFFGFLVTFMLFFVERWQLSVVDAGAAILPAGLVVIALTTQVGRLADLVGYRLPLVLGPGLMALCLALSSVVIGGGRFELRWLVVGAAMGIGIGLSFPLLAGAAVHGLDTGDLAAATAINQCARQLGAAIGVAATIGVLGTATTPALGRFHEAWLLSAAFCAVASAIAVLIPHSRGAAAVTSATERRQPVAYSRDVA